MELPPRARRILRLGFNTNHIWGTTSACAENTGENPPKGGTVGNYLRVRGEYVVVMNILVVGLELPPRARRIPNTPELLPPKLGTTSACAENTFGKPCGEVAGRNYLRVRGEYRDSF